MIGLLALAVTAGLASSPGTDLVSSIPVDPSAAPVPAPLRRRVERLALRVWPDSPCRGQVRAVYNADLATLIGPNVLGASWRSECTTAIAPISSPLLWCTTVIHEDGHLVGWGHRDHDVAGGIMRRRPLLRYAPCVAAAGLEISRAEAARRVRVDVRDADPRVARLVVRCARSVDVGTRVCQAAWRGGAGRYRVQRNEDGVTVS